MTRESPGIAESIPKVGVGMNNDSGSAFIMVATNRPMDLDDAV